MSAAEYQALVDWIHANGGRISSDLYLETVAPGNRTLRTRCAQSAGAVLINIPTRCCFGETDLQTTSLAFVKELAKGVDSFWYPYFRMLPTEEQFAEMPIYKYNKHSVQELQAIAPEFANQILRYQQEVDVLFQAITAEGAGVPASHKEYRYALYAVAVYHSRAWDKRGLIPIIDLIQHENDIALSGNVQIGPEQCHFKSARYLRAGEELSWCYQMNSNVMLYANYGIPMVPEQSYIPATLLWTPTDGPVSDYIKRCLTANNIGQQTEFKIAYTNAGLHQNAITFGRILNINEIDLKKIEETRADKTNPVEPILFSDTKMISVENEYETLRTFNRQLKNILSNMPVPTEEATKKHPILTTLIKHNISIITKTQAQLAEQWAQLLKN